MTALSVRWAKRKIVRLFLAWWVGLLLQDRDRVKNVFSRMAPALLIAWKIANVIDIPTPIDQRESLQRTQGETAPIDLYV